MDSLSYLQKKFSHYKKKYPSRPRYCAFRMIFSSIGAFCAHDKQLSCYNKKSKAGPCIVFSIIGGLGDFVIACNYIYCFYNYISAEKPIQIKIHYNSPLLLKAFCKDLPGVVETGTRLKSLTGNLQVELSRFPHILAGNVNDLANYSPRLNKLLKSWRKFFVNNRKLFFDQPEFDNMCNNYSELLGDTRINQADIGGLLSIPQEYQAPIPLPKGEDTILKSLGLNTPFITLNRGQGLCFKESTSNKLWSIKNYNQLIALLKQKYKQYQFVQLGMNREGYNENFENIDVNLIGKTNLEQLKVILKNSSLHIDCEGGLIHLRHALKGGPSVVLFGPTSPAVYGYKENLNLRSTACSQPCEWITDDWVVRCARRTDKNICMESLTPNLVMESIVAGNFL